MVKAKSFSSRNIDAIQEKINAWLSDINISIEIIDMKMTSVNWEVDKRHFIQIDVLILYKEI